MIVVGVVLVMIGLSLCEDKEEYKGVALAVVGIVVAVIGVVLLF